MTFIRKQLCCSLYFNKVAGFSIPLYSFIKRKPWHNFFHLNFVKFKSINFTGGTGSRHVDTELCFAIPILVGLRNLCYFFFGYEQKVFTVLEQVALIYIPWIWTWTTLTAGFSFMLWTNKCQSYFDSLIFKNVLEKIFVWLDLALCETRFKCLFVIINL